MANPLLLPPRLVLRALEDLHALGDAARRAPRLERELDGRFDALEGRLGDLLEAIHLLRPELVSQRETVEALRPELVGQRETTQDRLVPGIRGLQKGIRGLRDELGDGVGGLRDDLQGLNGELGSGVAGLRADMQGVHEELHGGIGVLRQALERVRAELGEGVEGLRSELRELRSIVEPLEGPAERIGRLSDRLPGR